MKIQKLFLLVLLATSANVYAGEFLVKLREAQNVTEVSASINATTVELVSHNLNVYLVKTSSVLKEEYVLAELTKLAVVAEPNYRYALQARPNDPYFGEQWALKNTTILDLDLEAERAWNITTGSDKVVVAILDTGMNYTSAELKDNAWTNTKEANGTVGVDDDKNGYADDVYGYDFYEGDSDPMDESGHGTALAGIVGAKGNNGIGIAGINWAIKIMPLRIGYNSYVNLANAIKALEYAVDKKADVILVAWAGYESELLEEVITRAQKRNILVVAAAGNSSYDIDSSPVYPASYTNENIITVAALSNRGALAYSNYGAKSVDVGAPGENIVSLTLTDRLTYGQDGTSYAAAHVAGIAALLKAKNPGMYFFDIKDRLMMTARKIPALEGKMVSPGMVTAYYALINEIPEPDDSDPLNWAILNQVYESPHPYPNNANESQTITVPGATRFALYFKQFETESGYDHVKFLDKNGNQIAVWDGTKNGQLSPVIDGDTVTLELTSDGSYDDYGYYIEKIYYDAGP